ncbi:hypothetical protein ACFOY2_40155 [Nonomuraea purpurea]|uniref:Lipoprotein n=1 Tax=Nonomuraea purpurea TaxID=1849276 RepID=A0ABV8GMH3_9ACTN
MVLAGCWSGQGANDACLDVRKVAASFPHIKPDDSGTTIIPRIDEELAAAREAQRTFADDVPPDFRNAWARMIDALQANRKAWQDATPWKGAPGTDMIGVLNLGEAKADEAKKALDAVADKHGFDYCGTAISWQY